MPFELTLPEEHTRTPMHQGDKGEVQKFAPDEVLYRRYLSVHFNNDALLPAAFKFPRQSFNRSGFSEPADVLHVDCCEGKVLEGYGVLECSTLFPTPIESADGRVFDFVPKHVPLSTCYAHSELRCSERDRNDAVYQDPPPSVKERFRIKLAQKMFFTIRIQAAL